MDILGAFNTGVAFSVGSLTVRWYGVIISCAMAVGIMLAYAETKRQHLDEDHLFNILLLVIPAAIIGARLYYVLFEWSRYAAEPGKIFAIWEGGLAIHGGIIAGALAIWLYCRAKREDFLRWTDIIAPSLAFGQACGRWGNYFNNEAYGSVIEPDSFWSWVPMQVFAEGAYHHPTFLYESLWDALIFVTLLILLRRPHRIGSIFACYLVFYSIGRFFIEMLRTDSLMLGPFKQAMLISAVGVVIGVLILSAINKRPLLDVAAEPPAKDKQYKKDKRRSKKGRAGRA
ncbi:MAG: prolipoprotein diacylglyceryl transferase [Bacillota bacterium]|nr:prolipoprotein diacylglyceryl transferase [Bacillota bacterium]